MKVDFTGDIHRNPDGTYAKLVPSSWTEYQGQRVPATYRAEPYDLQPDDVVAHDWTVED